MVVVGAQERFSFFKKKKIKYFNEVVTIKMCHGGRQIDD